MQAHCEQRGLECVLVVAALAILARELARMWIGCVAIRACFVCYRLLEVAGLMAIVADGFDMGSVEWKGSLVVIESGGAGPERFPARGSVAGVASCRECRVMRIFVAIGTGSERDVFVRNNCFRRLSPAAMTLVASDLLMQAS